MSVMLASLLLAMAPATASAPPTLPQSVPEKPQYIRLDPGNIMTVKEDGKFAISAAPEPLPIERTQIANVRKLGPEAMGANSVTTELPADSIKITDGQITFHLIHVGDETALLIRNGLSKSVRYKLVIKTERGLEPTDVCEIFAPGHGTEHWPYKIEWVAIGELKQFDRGSQAKSVCK